jgi:hypothetical protein
MENKIFRAKLKTKQQLLRMGWVENPKSTYSRLSVDGKRSWQGLGRYRNVPGTFTVDQVGHCLGQKCVVHSADEVDGVVVARVSVPTKFYNYTLSVPVDCLVGFDLAGFQEYDRKYDIEVEGRSYSFQPGSGDVRVPGYHLSLADLEVVVKKARAIKRGRP